MILSKSSGLVRNAGCDPTLVIELLFASVVETTLRIHQQFYAAIPQNTRADRRFVVPAAGTNVVFRCDKELRHCLGAQVSWHHKMPDLVAPER